MIEKLDSDHKWDLPYAESRQLATYGFKGTTEIQILAVILQ